MVHCQQNATILLVVLGVASYFMGDTLSSSSKVSTAAAVKLSIEFQRDELSNQISLDEGFSNGNDHANGKRNCLVYSGDRNSHGQMSGIGIYIWGNSKDGDAERCTWTAMYQGSWKDGEMTNGTMIDAECTTFTGKWGVDSSLGRSWAVIKSGDLLVNKSQEIFEFPNKDSKGVNRMIKFEYPVGLDAIGRTFSWKKDTEFSSFDMNDKSVKDIADKVTNYCEEITGKTSDLAWNEMRLNFYYKKESDSSYYWLKYFAPKVTVDVNMYGGNIRAIYQENANLN